ncbi:MAG: hypothetical protein ACXVA9_08465 [Bdellovibrionales bacterium]
MSDEMGITEWWWVEYLENEMDPVIEKDLELLLQHSEEDRVSFEHIRLVREWLGSCDPIKDWPLEDRLTRMRRKVMRAIEKDAGYFKDETKSLRV